MRELLNDIGMLFIRVGTGTLFLIRGLLNLFGGSQRWLQLGSRMEWLDIHSAFPLWGFLSACLMACGGIFIIIGLRLRPVAVILGTICFLAFATQANECNVAYVAYSLPALLILAGLFCTGSGPFSIDTYLAKRNQQP